MYLRDIPFDIMSNNESKLDMTINDHEVNKQGCDILGKHRNRVGGGVAIYIISIINITERRDLVPDDLYRSFIC